MWIERGWQCLECDAGMRAIGQIGQQIGQDKQLAVHFNASILRSGANRHVEEWGHEIASFESDEVPPERRMVTLESNQHRFNLQGAPLLSL